MSLTEAPSSPLKESHEDSLRFALGELTGSVRAHQGEIDRLRSSTDTLPERIVVALNPRLKAIETSLDAHDRRLTALERVGWLGKGGKRVLIGIATIIIIPLVPLILPHH